MSRFVVEYTPVIQKLWEEEARVRGIQREMLGHAARGVASFLRRKANGQSDKDAILGLADQADQVSHLCFNYPEPTGRG